MASRSTSLLSPVLRQLRPRTPRAAAPSLLRPSPSASIQVRLAHSIPKPRPIQPREPAGSSSPDAHKSEGERPAIKNSAYYQLSFTCVPCGHRSHHNVSKQGYHTGSTLITCPECRNRHVISDHLGIFGDKKVTIEDIMREKGQLVKRGSLGEDGDIEFWPDDKRSVEDGEVAALGSEETGKSGASNL